MGKDKDDFIGFKTNMDNRKKAMQFKSPDTSKMIPVTFDNNTTFYFKKGTNAEHIEKRLELHKKNKMSWE